MVYGKRGHLFMGTQLICGAPGPIAGYGPSAVLLVSVKYYYAFTIHTMIMTSFAVTLYGQCCRRHVVGLQVVRDISVVRSY